MYEGGTEFLTTYQQAEFREVIDIQTKMLLCVFLNMRC
jgi:hypothetical protein